MRDKSTKKFLQALNRIEKLDHSRITLKGSELEYQTHKYIELPNVILYGCRFKGCNLMSANFHRSQIHYTDFYDVNLQWSNLSNSVISFGGFRYCDLRNMDLRNSVFSHTYFTKCKGIILIQLVGRILFHRSKTYENKSQIYVNIGHEWEPLENSFNDDFLSKLVKDEWITPIEFEMYRDFYSRSIKKVEGTFDKLGKVWDSY